MTKFSLYLRFIRYASEKQGYNGFFRSSGGPQQRLLSGIRKKQIDKCSFFFHRVPSRFKRLYEFLD
ncbi:hypothetical protein, partial [uncultured Marinobacter sp.]|uniref:hypothetical protein n=1 Tax=uncultured Marinobacter sp. TaxID=187379 RepID=UPI0032B19596